MWPVCWRHIAGLCSSDVKPFQVIASLDAQLARHGQDVTLRRRIGTTNTYAELPCRAVLRGYNPNQLVGNIKQSDAMFIISPTSIAAKPTWATAAGGSAYPQINDFLLDGSRMRKIESAGDVVMNGVIVRFEGRVLG